MAAPCWKPAATALRGEWITCEVAFRSLAGEWDDLFRRSRSENAFLTEGWLTSWWKHFGRGRLFVIAMREENGRLAALAPFYVGRQSRALGARRLGFVGDTHTGSDRLEILCAPEWVEQAAQETARMLLEAQSGWDYMELCDTADSPVMRRFRECLEHACMRGERVESRTCYYIDLPASFDEYLAGAGISLRSNFRRRRRNLQRDFQAECVILEDPASLAQQFPVLLSLHAMRFAQRRMESAFLAPGVPAFHQRALQALGAQQLARLFLLKAGGEPVAALYGFSAGTTFQFYQCGMHPEWQRHGVGQVLIGNAIEYAIASGHRTFDFLRGGESYKTQWTPTFREITTWRFFPGRAGTRRAMLALHCQAALRAAARAALARLRH